MKIHALILFFMALALAGCNTASPQVQTRTVEIVSSKPYRYITFSKRDDPRTISEIKRHNRAHQAVTEAEKAATANQIKP